MNKIELLAPAGSFAALRAAVENGADAVYLGGSMFSARQYANNFSYKELIEAVEYAHSRGMKIHVAVNTLLANHEIKDLINYLYQLAEAQVDAIIVQDLGVAKLIRTALPDMELHGSTQMAVHNSAGVNFLEEMGFTRVVLAREVSLENISRIRENSSIELETFVHGALCISYSGQCLMSSLIGGRSGNRGRCAQPCRMKYSLVDNKGKPITTEKIGEYLLSPKDLKMIDYLPDLITAGIASLKVEGRMKRPEYVATVIRNYRQMIDNYYDQQRSFKVPKIVHKELEQIFNRGFTTGYFYGHQYKDLMSYERPNNRGLFLGSITKVFHQSIKIKLAEPLSLGDGYEVWVTKGGRLGGEVKEIKYQGQKVPRAEIGQEVEIKIGPGRPQVGDKVYKTNDALLMQKVKESFTSPKVIQRIPLELRVNVQEGQVITVEARDGQGYTTHCEGDFLVEKAQKYALNQETLWKQFARLGNTPFELSKLEGEIGEQLMVPMSELNQLRRKIVDNLLLARQREFLKKIPPKGEYLENINDVIERIPPQMPNPIKPLLAVLVGGPQALREAVNQGADQVYLNWEGLKNRENFSFNSLIDSINYCHEKEVKAILRLPTFVGEEKIERIKNLLGKVKNIGLDGFLIGNLGLLQLAKEYNLENIFADYTLNIFNDVSLFALLEQGIIQATLSPELTIEQIKRFKYLGNLPLEVIVHGNFPLMVSEYCAVGSVKGNRTNQVDCNNACLGGEFGLKDRMNFVFPLAMDEDCRMLIYNAKPLNLYKDIQSVLESGVDSLRIEARQENPQWIGEVTRIYRQAIDDWYQDINFKPLEESIKRLDKLEPNGSTTGHFFRGVI